MRIESIKTLVQVDLLQANRQLNTKDNASKLEKSNIYKRLIIQNVAVTLIFAVLFGSMLFNIPLADYPGIFTQTMSFMIIFSLLQIFQLIYNLFYDEGDLSAYLSLPFTVTELFFSKFISVIMTSFSYFMSPLILITILGYQMDYSIILSLLIGLISSSLIMVGTILSVFIGLDLLHRSSFFRKHRRWLLLVIYVGLFGLILYVLYGNDVNAASYGIEVMDAEIIPLFIGFHEIFVPGLQLAGWLKVGLWLLTGLGLSFVMYQWIVPKLYGESKENNQQSTINKKKRTSTRVSTSIWKVFLTYQFRQLQDNSLILQMLFSKFYLPFLMLAPTLFGDTSVDLSIINEIPHLWGAYLLIGAGIGILMITEMTISGVIISFDKENYHYIQSLPISFRGYLKMKFYFAVLIEWIISAVVIIGLAFYFSVPGIPLLILLVGYSVGTYLGALFYYMRDYRLLDLHWQNFNELIQRGVSQGLRLLIQLGILAFAVLILFSLLFWFVFSITETTRLVVSIGIVILLLLVVVLYTKHAKKNFWVQFNQ